MGFINFIQKQWKDRVVQYPNQRKLTDISTNQEQVVKAERDEGTIFEEGNKFNQAEMNDMEKRIGDAFNIVDKKLDIAFKENSDIVTQLGNGEDKIKSSSDFVVSSACDFEVEGALQEVGGELQPLRGVAIEAVGKNLFDKNKANLKGYYDPNDIFVSSKVDSSTDFIAIKENTTYFQNDGTTQYVNFYDNNFKLLRNETTNKDGVIGRFQSRLGDAYIRLSFRTNQLETYMVTEGNNRLVNYNAYISSKLVLDEPLAKLPNDVTDKIVRKNGKTIKRANTNVGCDGEFYELKAEDFDALDTSQSSIDRIRVNKPVDSIVYGLSTHSPRNWCVIEGFKLSDIFDTDASSLAGYVTYKNFSTKMMFYFNKGKYSNTEEVKADLVGTKIAYQLATPETIVLSDKLEPLNSYEGYTQFSVNDGVVEGEKSNLHDTGSSYIINRSDFADSLLKYKNKKFLKITNNGLDILGLGSIRTDLAYGGEHWEIQKFVVESNNIDINNITVDYTTSETNGQANAKITVGNSLISSVDSLSNSLNAVGERTDGNTKILGKSAGRFGLNDATGLSSTVGGLISWTNPVSNDFADNTLFVSTYDIKDKSFIELSNSGVTKYVITGTSQQVPTKPLTTYYVKLFSHYKIGGHDYYSDGIYTTFGTPDELTFFDTGNNAGNFRQFSASESGRVSVTSNYVEVSAGDNIINVDGDAEAQSDIKNVVPYSKLEIKYQVTRSEKWASGARSTIIFGMKDSGNSALASKVVPTVVGNDITTEIDISAISNAKVYIYVFSNSWGSTVSVKSVIAKV